MTRNETPILEGRSLRLRPPRESDMADRKACRRIPEEYRMYGMGREQMEPDSLENSDRWFAVYQSHPYHWVIESGGKCIGTTRLTQVDLENRSARFSIGIFDASQWNRGIGTEATGLVVDYAFEGLRLHRIALHVLASNQRAIACYSKCGFEIEGRLRDSVRVDEAWESEIVMAILHGGNRKSASA